MERYITSTNTQVKAMFAQGLTCFCKALTSWAEADVITVLERLQKFADLRKFSFSQLHRYWLQRSW